MEEQHPIPQQISAYQFRLVGDMTIKQFFQVAGGALVSLLIYSSNLPSYVKWPLIIISFLMGVALAFFPLEDRPLAKWIVLFFKAIYSPTLYYWQKTASKPVFFAAEPEEQKIEDKEAETGDFPVLVEKPSPGVKIEADFKKLDKKEEEFLSSVNLELSSSTLGQTPLPAVKKTVYAPQQNFIRVGIQPKPPITGAQKPQASSTPSRLSPMQGVATQDLKEAEYSQEAAPPSPPTTPNIIVGQVTDADKNIIENAILEIRDSEGRSVRALKSNKLGHFMIVTPLLDGNYEIICEKEGFAFDPISFEAKNELIPPIALRAKPYRVDSTINTNNQTS